MSLENTTRIVENSNEMSDGVIAIMVVVIFLLIVLVLLCCKGFFDSELCCFEYDKLSRKFYCLCGCVKRKKTHPIKVTPIDITPTNI